MKKVVFCGVAVLLCVLCAWGAAAEALPSSLRLETSPTGITHTVRSAGRYVNWAGVSTVSQFTDAEGHLAFAVDGGESVTIYWTQGGAVTGSVTIKNPYGLFGGAVCDEAGYLYMVWGYENPTENTNVETILVGKYTREGELIATVGGNGKEGMAWYYDESYYTLLPFDCGGCDVALAGDTLLVNYARTMYSFHQSNTVFVVNTADMTVQKGIISYNSHSFDQRVTPYSKTGGFLLVSQGDCFPRGFVTEVTSGARTLKAAVSFDFWVDAGAYDKFDMYKLNRTYARLGNILEVPFGAALVGSSARSLSESAKTEPYDVFVQVFDPNNATKPEGYIPAEERTGLAGKNGDTPATNYGVRWLTNLAGSGLTADEVQAVSIGEGRIAVLYELSGGGKAPTAWCTLLDGDGTVLREAEPLPGVRLNPDEDPVWADGAVQWVSNNGGKKLSVNRLTIELPETGTIDAGGPVTWTLWQGELTLTGDLSAEAPLVAAAYSSSGRAVAARAFTQSGDTMRLPARAETLRFFRLDAQYRPVSAPAELHPGDF